MIRLLIIFNNPLRLMTNMNLFHEIFYKTNINLHFERIVQNM